MRSGSADDLDERIAAQLELRHTAEAVDRAQQALHLAQAARDEQIRVCLALGVRSRHIRSIAGISATRLSQIRHGLDEPEAKI